MSVVDGAGACIRSRAAGDADRSRSTLRVGAESPRDPHAQRSQRGHRSVTCVTSVTGRKQPGLANRPNEW
ncbi:hypothetical protein GCM10010372_63690 [Streptomyces tauricus]|nr:hypothetical protein GCM10010372_63690 [Streptomyces tauricus]